MISVVVPCYSQARFLPEAMSSLLAQSLSAWELLVVDDGSPDDVVAVTQGLAAANPDRRIRLLRQPNCGVAAARNSGAWHACGHYLLFLDADDTLAPTMLEQAAAVLDTRPEVGFVYSGLRLFGNDAHTWPGVPFDLRLLALDNIVPPHALLRRACWLAVGGFDEARFHHGFEDWEFWLRVATSGWQGHHITQPLLGYRRHEASVTAAGLPHEWDTRALLVLAHPQLYSPRVVAWATRRAAQRSLPTRPTLRWNAPADVCEVAVPPGIDSADAPQASIVHSQPLGVPLLRRLVRRVPFRLRVRARWTLRRVQYGLRASGFWR